MTRFNHFIILSPYRVMSHSTIFKLGNTVRQKVITIRG